MYKLAAVAVFSLLLIQATTSRPIPEDEALLTFIKKLRGFVDENLEKPIDIYLDITVDAIPKKETTFQVLTKYLTNTENSSARNVKTVPLLTNS